MLKESRKEDVYPTNVRKAILKLNNTGFDEFRADLPEYDTPSKLVGKDVDSTFIPDITAKNRYGQKGYFEIARKTADEAELARKWELLSNLADLKQGVFKVFVPHGHMSFTQRLIDKYKIKAEIVKL